MARGKAKYSDPKLCVLIILDGWGVAEAYPGNAITAANTPVFDSLIENYPACTLTTRSEGSREAPSSESGHFSIGTSQFKGKEKYTVEENLGGVIAAAKLSQVRIAETEKFSHVTYYFNGRREQADREDHELIPSVQIKSYDQHPEMSAALIAKTTIGHINNEAYNFYAINFANADMIAHTGEFRATVKGVEKVDQALGEIIGAVNAKAGTAVICSDHGNAEVMIDPGSGKINNQHTANPVPFIIVDNKYKGHSLNWPNIVDNDLSLARPRGELIDVAPTIIGLLGLKEPSVMKGRNLI